MRVLIADDHPLVRRGVRTLLEESLPEVAIGEAKDFEGLMASVRKAPWDVVLLDLSMPGTSGFEGLSKLNRARPELPVLVLSMHPEDQYAVRALKCGAMGYLSKEHSFDELIKAVRHISTRRRYVSTALAERLALNLVHDLDTPPHEQLSQREYRVMCLIARGSTVSEIAARATLEREDRQHLPDPRARKDGDEEQRRADAVLHRKQAGRVTGL